MCQKQSVKIEISKQTASNRDDCVAPASAHPPGTTPLVAMALIEMAVSMVCVEMEEKEN